MTDTITESLKAIQKYLNDEGHLYSCEYNQPQRDNRAIGLKWQPKCTCGYASSLQHLTAIQTAISSAESDAGKLAEAVLARYVATMPYEEAIKDCAKPITAALLKAASVKAQDETGWLIELAASPPSEPKYWQNGSLWTGDNIKAIRFARKEDAERIAALMLDGMNIRICEHIWTA